MASKYQYKITIRKTETGKAIRKTFYSSKSVKDAKRKAEEWRIQSEARYLAGVTDPKQVTFSVWADQWLEKYKKPYVSVKSYEDTYKATVNRYLVPFFKDTVLSKIKPIDISAFFAKYVNYSQSLNKKMLIILKAMFEEAIDNGYMASNPCRRIHPQGNSVNKKDTYTDQERSKLLEYARFHPYGLAITILLECGLRPSELLALRKKDFNTVNKTLTISNAIAKAENGLKLASTKTEASYRTIPISKELSKRMEGFDGDFLFLTKDGNFMTEQSFTRHRYNKFFENIDIRKLSPYAMRHTCATLLYEKTHDIYAVSKFMGHASVDITARTYVHENVEDLRKQLAI